MTNNQLSSYVRPLPQQLSVSGVQGSNGIQQGEIDVREYFRIFFKYRYLILLVSLTMGGLALIYSFLLPKQYTAEGVIKISTYEPILSAAKVEDILQAKSREANFFETQVQEISSMTVADLVLDDAELKKKIFRPDVRPFSFFGSGDEEIPEVQSKSTPYKNKLSEIKQYRNIITVKPVPRTALVTISARTNDPKLSAEIVNRHAEVYIDWVKNSRVQRQSSGLRFLQSQAEELKDKVANLEREMADYAEENSIVAVNKDENIVAQRMSQLNQLLSNASSQRIEAENAYREAEAALSKDSAGYDDSSIQSLRLRLGEFESEYSNLSAKFLPTYPKMVQLKSQIENLRETIRAQREQIVAGLKSKALAAAEQEKNIKDQLDQQTSRAFELSKKQVQYNILSRESDSSRELLQNVLRQIKETTLAVESNASNVAISDYALIPKSASYPKKKLFLFVGLCSGALIGIGLALFLGYVDNTFRTPDQISQVLGLPSLGLVPAFDLEERFPEIESRENLQNSHRSESVTGRHRAEASSQNEQAVTLYQDVGAPLVYIDQPKSLAAEAYRTIRTGVLLSQAGKPPKTILVTSAQSAEGKTTSVSNLAATLASTGGSVVVVDADLRRPSVYKYFGLDKTLPGTVEVLTGQMAVEQVLLREVTPLVSILPSGRIPPNPAELLGSNQMVELINLLAENFDYVLIDSPPILPVTDTVLLSRFVDAVVLVVKAGATPRKVVADAKLRLQNAGANVIGTVLNNVNITGGDYYYYNRYYYSYYSEDNGHKTRAA